MSGRPHRRRIAASCALLLCTVAACSHRASNPSRSTQGSTEGSTASRVPVVLLLGDSNLRAEPHVRGRRFHGPETASRSGRQRHPRLRRVRHRIGRRPLEVRLLADEDPRLAAEHEARCGRCAARCERSTRPNLCRTIRRRDRPSGRRSATRPFPLRGATCDSTTRTAPSSLAKSTTPSLPPHPAITICGFSTSTRTSSTTQNGSPHREKTFTSIRPVRKSMQIGSRGAPWPWSPGSDAASWSRRQAEPDCKLRWQRATRSREKDCSDHGPSRAARSPALAEQRRPITNARCRGPLAVSVPQRLRQRQLFRKRHHVDDASCSAESLVERSETNSCPGHRRANIDSCALHAARRLAFGRWHRPTGNAQHQPEQGSERIELQ